MAKTIKDTDYLVISARIKAMEIVINALEEAL